MASYSYQQYAPDASPPWDYSSYDPSQQYDGAGGSFDGRPFSTGSFSGSLNPSQLQRMFLIHGILATVAFVFLFPLGAILLRVTPGPMAIWVHAGTQTVSLLVFSAAFGIGVYFSSQIAFGRFRLIDNYHAVIGIVVFSLLASQPLTGFIHHLNYKRLRRRTGWSHLHRFLGASGIALGIINGGLGLMLAGAPESWKIAYGVVAGVMGFAWLVVSLWGATARNRQLQQQIHPAHRSKGSSASSSDRPSGHKESRAGRSNRSRRDSESEA